MKICFIGDVHAQFANLEFIVNNVDSDVFIQLGDYGIWTDCLDVLPGYYRICLKKPLYFIEGNHDNHTFLKKIKMQNPDWKHGIRIEDEFDLFWMPRGSEMEINGKKFLFCGGADSIDKEYRLQYYPETWWEDERVTESVLDCNDDYDFVIAHDRPTFVSRRLGYKVYNTGKSSDVLEKLYGKMNNLLYWINAHWHNYNEIEINGTDFITLNMLPMNFIMNEKDIELTETKYGMVNNMGNVLVMEI